MKYHIIIIIIIIMNKGGDWIFISIFEFVYIIYGNMIALFRTDAV